MRGWYSGVEVMSREKSRRAHHLFDLGIVFDPPVVVWILPVGGRKVGPEDEVVDRLVALPVGPHDVETLLARHRETAVDDPLVHHLAPETVLGGLATLGRGGAHFFRQSWSRR